MKRYFILCLALALMLALSGCGECEHKWTPVDCENGSVCDKCGETGESALGHDWAAASCETPETCTRCGKTQGEALAHIFGEWTVGDTDRSRACTACGLEEREELDDTARFLQLLTGHWDMYSITIMDRTFMPYHLDSGLGHTVDYEGGESFRYHTGKIGVDLILKHVEYDAQSRVYSGSSATDVGEPFSFTLEEREDGNLLHLVPENHKDIQNEIVFSQYNTSRSVMEGTWAAVKNGVIYHAILTQDGSFTGDLGGEVSGKWQPMPADEAHSSAVGSGQLIYRKDGWETAANCHVLRQDESDQNSGSVMNVNLGGNIGELTFRKMAQDGDFDTLKAAAQEGCAKMVGQWNSTSARRLEGEDTAEYEARDYVLTVKEDGSFSIKMDWEIKGKWYFDSVILRGGGIDYIYRFSYPAGTKGGEEVIFSTKEGKLSFPYKQADEWFHLTFAQAG